MPLKYSAELLFPVSISGISSISKPRTTENKTKSIVFYVFDNKKNFSSNVYSIDVKVDLTPK